MAKSKKFVFEPRAHMLILLGDQLIRDVGIAVFELVKNAYDADATKCIVTLRQIQERSRATITVEDDGTGMSLDTIRGVWLEPGTDYRREQRAKGERTKRFHRLPLGEKGVGRFAVHKLGKRIALITRARGCQEVVVKINWEDFEKAKYLRDAFVSVRERDPEHFRGRKTGTHIRIMDLREAGSWTRGKVRDLHRAVNSICSLFGGPDRFRPRLVLDPDPGPSEKSSWLAGLKPASEFLQDSLFRASATLVRSTLAYTYTFKPLPAMDRVKGRRRSKRMSLSRSQVNPETGKKENKTLDLKANGWRIGPLSMELRIFDRDPAILALGISDPKGLRDFLNSNGGIRVYRDGVRVYDFGEPGNDWLELGGRRVNVPAARISNNLVIGAVNLRADKSQDLVEKTNREGFKENEAYRAFRDAVIFAITQIELERNKDKDRVRNAYSGGRKKEPVLDDLWQLRKRLKRRGLGELEPYIDRVEKQFLEVRDTLLTAASAGLSLAVVIHEVEKGIAELNKAVKRRTSGTKLRILAQHLSELIDGLGYLTRKSGRTREKASVLIEKSLFNTDYRLSYHGVEALNGLETGDTDFQIRCTRRLIIATIMNLIDNAIWWLENQGSRSKRIYIGTSLDFKGGPALVVADNGPGLIDPAEYLVRPFFTRKPDGMGLGLHIASEVMKAHKGRLTFPEKGDVALPKGFDGAVVALVFGGK